MFFFRVYTAWIWTSAIFLPTLALANQHFVQEAGGVRHQASLSADEEQHDHWEKAMAALKKEFSEIEEREKRIEQSFKKNQDNKELQEQFERVHQEGQRKWGDFHKAIRYRNMYKGLIAIKNAKNYEIGSPGRRYADQSKGGKICTAVAVAALYGHLIENTVGEKKTRDLVKELRNEIMDKNPDAKEHGCEIDEAMKSLQPKWNLHSEQLPLWELILRGKPGIISLDFQDNCQNTRFGRGHAYALLGYKDGNIIVEDFYKGRHQIKAADVFRCSSTFDDTSFFAENPTPTGYTLEIGR